MPLRTLGQQLKRLRAPTGLTQAQLAKRAKVSESLIRHLEQDRVTVPSIWIMWGIAVALRVSLDTLLDGVERPKNRGNRYTSTKLVPLETPVNKVPKRRLPLESQEKLW